MNDAKKEPWLLVLMKGQVLNKDAEALGKGPWWPLVPVVLVTVVLAAFPFVNDKFTAAFRSANPALYPGLTEVFVGVRDRGWDLKVDGGQLVTGAGVPAQDRVGDWLVVFEGAGGDPEAIQRALGSSGTSVVKVAFFGRSAFGLLDSTTKARFDGTWEKLEGFASADLEKLGPAKLLPILLYAAATGGAVRTMVTVLLLMFVQVVFLTVILGFLLSLSQVKVAGTTLGPKRAAGFLSSVKTAGYVALGPAFVVCLVLAFLPGASALSWVVFTLLFGLRIVLIYTGRFRNKTPPVNG